MPHSFSGKFDAKGGRFGIVVARFNDFITSKLLDACVDGLLRHGAADDDITVAWVPGAFEIPLVAKRMANSGRFDAIIALGCVIRGSTPHFDYVCAEVSKGVGAAAWSSNVPVIFGVLTTNSIEQAIERAGTKAGNKGFDAALAAIEMVDLLKALPGSDT